MTFRGTVIVLTTAMFLAISTAAAWAWSAHQEGNTWYVREGGTKITMPDEKTAKSVASDFNKIDAKADKRAGKGDKKDDKKK